MPVASKISAREVINPPQPALQPPPNSSLQIALTFYFANRETPVPRYYKFQNGKMKKVVNHGYSIRRVAQMHLLAATMSDSGRRRNQDQNTSSRERHDLNSCERGSS